MGSFCVVLEPEFGAAGYGALHHVFEVAPIYVAVHVEDEAAFGFVGLAHVAGQVRGGEAALDPPVAAGGDDGVGDELGLGGGGDAGLWIFLGDHIGLTVLTTRGGGVQRRHGGGVGDPLEGGEIAQDGVVGAVVPQAVHILLGIAGTVEHLAG